jgi:hypothetical protein
MFAFPFTGKLAPVLGMRRIAFNRSIFHNAICPGFRLERAMIETLTFLLRVAGSGLILLAALHVPIGRHLKWREQALLLSPVNASIFRVHAFFICFVLVMMGLPCMVDPSVFLEASHASAWMAWSFAVFWAIRLFVQWFVYPRDLWRGKKMETIVHAWVTVVWLSLAVLFAVCGMRQAGWLR